MFPAMRVVFPIIGLLFGAASSLGGSAFFSGILCALVGFMLADLLLLRANLTSLQEELRRLRSAYRRRDGELFGAGLGNLDLASEAARTPMAAVSNAARGVAPTQAAPVVNAAAAAADLPGVALLKNFLSGGNTLVRGGVVILFFGVAFLLRYAAEHSHLPIGVRMAGVGCGGLTLLAAGWRLRRSRPGYALALQGGAVGILYLNIFAAMRLYSLVPPQIAFALLIAVALLSAALALLQDSLAFALLAVTGGFLAPVLAAAGEVNHEVLFSYFAVLNAGILGMAWFKAWRPLNRVGFLFTFVIATGWGVLHYRPQDFASTEPFLVLFFLFYVAIAVLFTCRQAPGESGRIDGTSVFGVPIVAFGLQSGLLHSQWYALAFSAVAMSVLYLCLAWVLYRRRNAQERLLSEAFLALGVAFFTLAIPLAFEARWNAAAWALEGCALIWVGARQRRLAPRVFGSLAIFAAGVVLLPQLQLIGSHLTLPQASSLSVLLLAVAALYSAKTLHSHRALLTRYESWLPQGLFGWGVLWWLVAAAAQLTLWLPPRYLAAAILMLFAATAWLASKISGRWSLPVAAEVSLLLLPMMLLCAVQAAHAAQHPCADGGSVAWPAAFAVFYVSMRRHEATVAAWRMGALHTVSLWLLVALCGWEAEWEVARWVGGSAAWSEAAAFVPAALALWLLPWLTRRSWPFAPLRRIYLASAGGGLAAALIGYGIVGNLLANGDAQPLPYAPLLNPFDAGQIFILLALLRYGRCLQREGFVATQSAEARWGMGAFVAVAFLFANGVLLRSLHQWTGVPLEPAALMGSTLVQTALSIFWTVLALVTMLAAARRRVRPAWMAGAGLISIVVAKLFLIDLSRVGSVERIVSFVGVGLLMLIVGYWSPIPPARQPTSVQPPGA